MPRIHFVVSETAKIAYRAEAHREGKSLGEWMREAADEKLPPGVRESSPWMSWRSSTPSATPGGRISRSRTGTRASG